MLTYKNQNKISSKNLNVPFNRLVHVLQECLRHKINFQFLPQSEEMVNYTLKIISQDELERVLTIIGAEASPKVSPMLIRALFWVAVSSSPHASDLIAEGALVVESAFHIDDLPVTIHAPPTLPEGIEEAAEAVENKAIHIFNPKL